LDIFICVELADFASVFSLCVCVVISLLVTKGLQ